MFYKYLLQLTGKNKMTVSQSITENATNPAVVVPTSITAAGANFMGLGVPDLINILMVIYLGLVVVHKSYQMYKEFKSPKGNSNASNE